ncbi:unnamed protein product, partial [Mesorhabditis spiculigera]
MGLQAHAVASSDGWLRPLFWFLLVCSNFGSTDQLRNFLDLPFDDPLNLSPAMLRNHHRIRRQEKDCPTRRQFICYAYDVVEEPYPDWLQNTEAKCEKCKTDIVCKDTDKVETATDDGRLQSGPYAQFMSEEENLRLDVIINTTVAPTNQSDPTVKPEANSRRILNKYQFNHAQALDDEGGRRRICKGRTEPTTIAPSASGPNEDESGLGLRLAVAAAVVGICLLAAVATVGVLYKQKRIFYHQLAEPLPQHHVAANVELAWQPYGGSWEARFYRKVTGQPPKVKPSSLGYSLKGHLALCMKSEKLNPGVPWPLNGKGCPIPSTNEPIRDPVVVAETLLSALAQDNLVTVYNSPRMTTEQLRNGFDPNDESAELTRLRLSLQWNDPCNVEADGPEWPYNTSRGCAQYFNKQMIDDFRAMHGIDFIIRAHQSVPTGVSFFGNWLISLFTTPHKDSFGAILRYDGNKFTFLHIIPPTLDVTDVASLDHCFAQAMGFKPFEPESQQQNPAEKAPVAPEEQRTERIHLAAPAAPAATK